MRCLILFLLFSIPLFAQPKSGATDIDSINVGARNDSSMTITIYVPIDAATKYITGTISGNNVGEAEIRAKP